MHFSCAGIEAPDFLFIAKKVFIYLLQYYDHFPTHTWVGFFLFCFKLLFWELDALSAINHSFMKWEWKFFHLRWANWSKQESAVFIAQHNCCCNVCSWSMNLVTHSLTAIVFINWTMFLLFANVLFSSKWHWPVLYLDYLKMSIPKPSI